MQNMCIVTFYDISAHKNKKSLLWKKMKELLFLPFIFLSSFLMQNLPQSE